MNGHLSTEQISNVVIGGASIYETRHARECAECGVEVERMESALRMFRGAMVQIAAHEPERFLAPVRWGSYQPRETAAALSSLLFHGVALASILVIGSLATTNPVFKDQVVKIFAPDLKPYKAERETAHGGGGGGDRSKFEAKNGAPPKATARQFVPPSVNPPESAKLVMTPTIIADLPTIASNIGDPSSQLGMLSNGPGCCAGIGNGDGTGVGVGKGPGAGDGRNGGFGGAFSIGGGVSAPILISHVEPEYADEARRARFQGTVKLEIVVDAQGIPRQMRVTRSLGLGLDEKAMEAVAKWRFKPGMKGGKPVPVIATVEVNFRLL